MKESSKKLNIDKTKEYILGALEVHDSRTIDTAIREIRNIEIYFRDDIPELVTAIENSSKPQNVSAKLWQQFQEKVKKEYATAQRRSDEFEPDEFKIESALSESKLRELINSLRSTPLLFEQKLKKYIKENKLTAWQVRELPGLKEVIEQSLVVNFFRKSVFKKLSTLAREWGFMEVEDFTHLPGLENEVLNWLVYYRGNKPEYERRLAYALEEKVFNSKQEIERKLGERLKLDLE